MAKRRIIRGKVIGGVLGMLLAGPFGAGLGLWLGHLLDKRALRRRLGAEYALNRGAVAAAVVVLAAKLAKADGAVSSSEILTFRRLFRIPDEETRQVGQLWARARETPLGYEPYAVQLAQMFGDVPAMRRRIVDLLWAVALADGTVGAEERAMLDDVALLLEVERSRGAALPVRPWRGVTHAGEAEQALGEMFAGVLAGGSLAGAGAQLEAGVQRASGLLRRWSSCPWARPALASLNAAIAFVMAYHFAPVPVGVPLDHLAFSAGLAALCWLGSMLTLPRQRTLEEEIRAAAGTDAQVDPGGVVQAIEQGRRRLAAIRQLASGCAVAIRTRIEAICAVAERMVEALRSDPADVVRVQPFLGHYLSAVQDMVERYAALQSRADGTARLASLEERFAPLLQELETLFVKQYERIVEDEARALDLEIDVLRRMVRAEGAQGGEGHGLGKPRDARERVPAGR